MIAVSGFWRVLPGIVTRTLGGGAAGRASSKVSSTARAPTSAHLAGQGLPGTDSRCMAGTRPHPPARLRGFETAKVTRGALLRTRHKGWWHGGEIRAGETPSQRRAREARASRLAKRRCAGRSQRPQRQPERKRRTVPWSARTAETYSAFVSSGGG